MTIMANSVDVGQKKALSEKRTLFFNFHDFADLRHKRGESIVSPALSCHGFLWAVRLYPRGEVDSSTDKVYVSVYLKCLLNEGQEKQETKAKFSIEAGRYKSNLSCTFRYGDEDDDYDSWGWSDFDKREDILDETQHYLPDGTLTFKVDLQVYLEKPEPWKPPTLTLTRRMLDLYETGHCSDVAIKVGDKKFLAHKMMLTTSAPILFQLAEDATGDIEVDGVDPLVFEKMLRFIYTEELPSTLGEEAETLLDVADKFGCTNLKIFAETELATNSITIENAAEMFLLGDRKNCALLKEASTMFFVLNAKDVMKTCGFAKLQESSKLVAELMTALADPPTFSDRIDESDVDRMGVNTLRRKLDDAGLEVDGTREMLVKRLKTNKSDLPAVDLSG